MSPREVADQLSVREFVKLCAAIDVARPVVKTKCGSASGSGYYQVSGGKLVRRFDVVKIEVEVVQKKVRRKLVTVDVEGESVLLRFDVAA